MSAEAGSYNNNQVPWEAVAAFCSSEMRLAKPDQQEYGVRALKAQLAQSPGGGGGAGCWHVFSKSWRNSTTITTEQQEKPSLENTWKVSMDGGLERKISCPEQAPWVTSTHIESMNKLKH